jgi:hypothetical protein
MLKKFKVTHLLEPKMSWYGECKECKGFCCRYWCGSCVASWVRRSYVQQRSLRSYQTLNQTQRIDILRSLRGGLPGNWIEISPHTWYLSFSCLFMPACKRGMVDTLIDPIPPACKKTWCDSFIISQLIILKVWGLAHEELKVLNSLSQGLGFGTRRA